MAALTATICTCRCNAAECLGRIQANSSVMMLDSSVMMLVWLQFHAGPDFISVLHGAVSIWCTSAAAVHSLVSRREAFQHHLSHSD